MGRGVGGPYTLLFGAPGGGYPITQPLSLSVLRLGNAPNARAPRAPLPEAPAQVLVPVAAPFELCLNPGMHSFHSNQKVRKSSHGEQRFILKHPNTAHFSHMEAWYFHLPCRHPCVYCKSEDVEKCAGVLGITSDRYLPPPGSYTWYVDLTFRSAPPPKKGVR